LFSSGEEATEMMLSTWTAKITVPKGGWQTHTHNSPETRVNPHPPNSCGKSDSIQAWRIP
jgi:hypothetical protein